MRQTTEPVLTGKRILITRPAEQAAPLATLIQQAGGEAVVFPAIEIAEPANLPALKSVIARLLQFDRAIFISPTAVARAFHYLDHWPAGLSVAAIGAGSARALQRAGVQNILVPEQGQDSEALLALPEMQQVNGLRIVIFRGEGGRELLADVLRERGAQVEYAECYRRIKPQADIAPLLSQHLDAIVVTSREGLQNLRELLGEHWPRFQKQAFFVPHPRIGDAANALGIAQTITTIGGDVGYVEALSRFFRTNPGAV